MSGTLGKSSSTFYFYKEGRENLPKTLELVLKRAKSRRVKKLIIFTRDGDSAFQAAKLCDGLSVIAVTFPYKQRFTERDDKGNERDFVAPTSMPEVAERLRKAGVSLVRGTMPFQQVVIPYVRDPKVEGIKHALGLFGDGLSLCVQAVLMATDAGEIEPAEEVVSMSADTAIVATGTSSHWLFHPAEGMEIREIICKPRVLTVSRDK